MRLGWKRRAERAPSRAAAVQCNWLEPLEGRLLYDAADFDPSFGTGGIAQLFINAGLIRTTAVTVDPHDGSSVVVGYTNVAPLDDPDFVVIRFRADGSADPSFGGGTGFVVQDMIANFSDFATSVTIQDDGKILVAGYTDGFTPAGLPDRDIVLGRFNPDGSLDSTFGNVGRPGISQVDLTLPFATTRSFDIANAVIVQPDGNIIVGGATSAVSGDVSRSDFALVRFTPTGQFDRTFGFNGISFVTTDFGNDDGANALAVQPDGKIIAVGTTNLFEGFIPTTRVAVVRYNPDGSVDNTFSQFGGQFILTFDSQLIAGHYDGGYAVTLQPDGKILVGGVNGFRDDVGTLVAQFATARFNGDGSLDPSWGGVTGGVITNLGVLAGVSDIAVQPDGKVVVGGKIAASEADASAGRVGVAVVRYNSDGSIDGAFSGDGRVLLDSDFTSFNTADRPAISGVSSSSSSSSSGAIRPLDDSNPDTGLVQEFETFQANTQGLIDVTPKGRILIVAFKDQTVRVAQVLGSGPPVANAALKGDRFTESPLPAIEFDVEYVDDVAVALSTLGDGDVIIVAPGGAERPAVFIGANGATGDAERISGRYRFLPADGQIFRASENGAYSIVVADNQVGDNAGGFVARDTVGSFELAVTDVGSPTPTPTPTPTPAPTPTPTPDPTPTPTPTPTRIPGIAVAAVAGKVPPAVIGGDKKAKAALAVTLANAGAADYAGAVAVTLFASTDGTTNAGAATQLAQVSAKLKLKAGATKAVKLNAGIPALPDGNYTLVASVTGDGADNVEFFKAGPAISVEQPIIRLTVPTPVAAGKPLAFGKSASLSLPLQNGGNVMAKGAVTIEILASQDGNAANAVSLGSATAKVSVKPGTSKATRFKLTLPASLPAGAGSYVFLAKLTAIGSLGATNATDGTIVGSIQVSIA